MSLEFSVSEDAPAAPQPAVPELAPHVTRASRVLWRTMVHEFGHAVLLKIVDFPAVLIKIHTPAYAETRPSEGLWALTGQLNQNYLREAAMVAVAGVCAEGLLSTPRLSGPEIGATLLRYRNRVDNGHLKKAVSKAKEPIEVSAIIDEVSATLGPLMERLKEIARDVAEWYVRETPELPSILPAHFLARVVD